MAFAKYNSRITLSMYIYTYILSIVYKYIYTFIFTSYILYRVIYLYIRGRNLCVEFFY